MLLSPVPKGSVHLTLSSRQVKADCLQALLIVGSSSTLGKAKVGNFASETLPQGGDRVLRDHIRHLKTEGLIMRAD